jgi:hypothetical protein
MNTITSTNAVQPSIEMPYVAKQPTSRTTMSESTISEQRPDEGTSCYKQACG